MITHSLIIAVLESYTMVDRQVRLLAELLSEHWELILVDDGSVPEIPVPERRPANTTILRTAEKREPGEWTQKLQINKAVQVASGEYIVKNDIDHVFTPEAIAAAERFGGDMMLFHRTAGILREDLSIEPIRHSVRSPIDDIYVMRRQLFLELGGYPVTRHYGYAGKCFAEYSCRPEAQPPRDALIYVVPEPHAVYHGLERVR